MSPRGSRPGRVLLSSGMATREGSVTGWGPPADCMRTHHPKLSRSCFYFIRLNQSRLLCLGSSNLFSFELGAQPACWSNQVCRLY